MDYSIALMQILLVLFALFTGIQLWSWIVHLRLLYRVKRMPFPDSYKAILDKIPLYTKLPEKDRATVHYLILRFINEKEFIGLYRLSITDEIRVVIAFYACLLLLRIREHDCYGNLKTILVYPYEFIVNEQKSFGGIYTRERSVLQGESVNDAVVISWHAVKKEAYHVGRNNVVIHEFAHELDFMDGELDGAPPMSRDHYRAWSDVMYKHYKRLSEKSIAGRYFGKYKLLGHYAATNEAEFFAVVTERFFESPHALQHHFPDVYKKLKRFYRIDTAKLFG